VTELFNDPRTFREQAVAGFSAAHSRYVQQVRGGVIRSTGSPKGRVAPVLGGGAGHDSAFAGWVGPGLGHGAACGNVFSSPSVAQVYSVARAAHQGGSVVLGFGNYAGDVSHFGQAAERLGPKASMHALCRSAMTLPPGPASDWSRRRGIAGDLVVFKVAGAATEAGRALDGVAEVSQRANERTRALGVAFGACILPGADGLFLDPELEAYWTAPADTARRGRAKTTGDSSLGHADPGATSFAFLTSAVGELLDGKP
jgi:L-erythrulose 1-kinase